jgi:hypothetical protein
MRRGRRQCSCAIADWASLQQREAEADQYNSQSDSKYPTLTDYPGDGAVLYLARKRSIHDGNHLTGVFYAICPSTLSVRIFRPGCLAPLPSSLFSQAKEGRQPTVLIHS